MFPGWANETAVTRPLGYRDNTNSFLWPALQPKSRSLPNSAWECKLGVQAKCSLSLCPRILLETCQKSLPGCKKKKKTASFRLKGQVIFLLQSLYSSFRCLGQEKRRISLVSAPFSQISQQLEACISQHRLGYAAVTTTTPPPQISLGSNSKSVFCAHAQCPLNRAQLTGVT